VAWDLSMGLTCVCWCDADAGEVITGEVTLSLAGLVTATLGGTFPPPPRGEGCCWEVGGAVTAEPGPTVMPSVCWWLKLGMDCILLGPEDRVALLAVRARGEGLNTVGSPFMPGL
jgi:hypothetical protein